MSKIKMPAGPIGPQFVKKILPWVEQYWYMHGRYPSDVTIMERYGFSRLELDKIHASKFYKNCLKDRGISFEPMTSFGFSEKQQACITIMANVHDTRSTDVKLASIGVTPQMYNGWLQDRAFLAEVQRRVEDALDYIFPDAQAALAKQVKGGNINALKFYYEITGRAATPEVMNVRMMMNRVIEAVQKHVKDPAILQAIAEEIKSAERASVADGKIQQAALPSQPSSIAAQYKQHVQERSNL